MKLRTLWNHVTHRVWELMQYSEKSLKNTCGGNFLKNVAESQPIDLLNNDLLNRIFLRILIKLSKDLFEQAMVAVSIVR